MNKKLLLLVLGTLVLGACSTQPRTDPRALDQSTPQVGLVDGRIVVPLSLVYSAGQPNGKITWQLALGSKATFAENGIVIEGRVTDELIRGNNRDAIGLDPKQTEITNCSRSKDGLEFSCVNRHSQPGVYKYTIRLVDETRKSYVFDPFVVNM
jgi:hypothetical protein